MDGREKATKTGCLKGKVERDSSHKKQGGEVRRGEG